MGTISSEKRANEHSEQRKLFPVLVWNDVGSLVEKFHVKIKRLQTEEITSYFRFVKERPNENISY